MCKTKILAIEQSLQKNIRLVAPEVQIYQKHYKQFSYEDTSYKIRIFDDCKSISLRDLKKVFRESTKKDLTVNVKKQDQRFSNSSLLINYLSKQERDESNEFRKKYKKLTVKIVKKFSFESESNDTLIEADFVQNDVEYSEKLELFQSLHKYEPEAESRRKSKQNITSIINYLTEKQPNPSEDYSLKVQQISKQIIFQRIQRVFIILALFANIISIIWNFNCIEYKIGS